MQTAVERRKLLETGAGTLSGAFGASEWGLMAGIAAIWGSSFLFIAMGLDSFRPGLVSLARLSLGALALALVPRARQRVEREDWPRIVVLGVVWMGLPLILFPIAQQWVDSAVAGMINGAVPLATAAWATALMRRLPGSRQRWGLLVGFAGVVAISWPGLTGSMAATRGVLLLILAITCYGLAANVAVPLQQRYGSLPVMFRAQLVALLMVAPFGLAQLDGSSWSWASALAMVPLGVLGTGFAYVMMGTLVGRVGGTRGSVAVYFTPPVAIALGALLRDEVISPYALLGTAMVLVGAWLTSRRESSTPARSRA